MFHSAMRKKRFLGRPGSSYHVISRFVDRQFALGEDRAKRVFLDLMRRQAAFSGVQILTYCIMGNHFHLLLRVPERPELPEAEVLRRTACIWGNKRQDRFEQKLAELREMSAVGEHLAEQELDAQRRRMYDLSEFVKDLKQRFSVWYNKEHERKGTLFEERFKSVLVEDGRARRMMAAYIDLNPVRAGIVEDPVDYLWCGYANAVGGNRDARAGIRHVMRDPLAKKFPDWRKASDHYRRWLHERGIVKRGPSGAVLKPGFSRAEAIAAWEDGGEIPLAKYLLCKARFLTESVAFGSPAFIEEQIEANRSHLGKHPKPHASSSGLCALKGFRGRAVAT